MNDNFLIPLTGFELPPDYPWRVGFVGLVNEQLRRLRATGYFVPSRFFGYYFQGNNPIGVSGNWTVSLEPTQPVALLPEMVGQYTGGKFSISSTGRAIVPDYMLVHDRLDGACWLWSFTEGLQFVEAVEPTNEDGGWDNAEQSKHF
ncbi:hypothetical protein [Opitutus sp. ER46]|uniref:hypothetical protein n=1 Tax=Opitutus sp. ER46 TaxID=2161864 RepID=UPI0011B2251C|nr:hypothetical protein [Opitutus sp. ER46]